ncbi:hypothetical protein H6784_03610 [Candidatus Nomurabacteria bacterium]|nr:hypothetical protein [Candidatus Kaiserbacteria bacterium]MCB9814476.1 hypothetical protein [Candidatus Nomurabacteria bacterium]
MNEYKHHLLKLGLSDSEVTVYLAMVAGAVSARDLVKVTEIKRPTVYYALGSLEKRGLVSRTGSEGVGFALNSIEQLSVIAEEKETQATHLKDEILELIPALQAQTISGLEKPTVSFFEGKEAVRRVAMESLYCRSKKLYSIAPKDNFFWQVGEEFALKFINERIKRNIQAKNLWDDSVDSKLLKKYYDDSSEVRVLPKIMRDKFKTTIFLFDDKTLYISSVKNSYCILMVSQEHKDTMQALFDGLWFSSKAHK